jgi:orotidine-5'-phosphate decarboxylase
VPFIAAGTRAVAELHARQKRVFLDLKLHDIPETVKRAARAAAEMKVDLLTVHAGGGAGMLAAAVQGAYDGTDDKRHVPRVLAVTVLTSQDQRDLAEDGHPLTVEELVLRRARVALGAGVTGFVASVHEAAALRALGGEKIFIVTPGVRLPGSEAGDQKRVASPRAAIEAGADAIVVGRPIRDAPDPLAVVGRLLQDLG